MKSECADQRRLMNKIDSNDSRPLILLVIAVSFLAISNQSLWIDEAHTALKARQPDFKTWWQTMVSDSGSDLQMPLYMFHVWVFAKLFGSSEYVLRLAGLPWLVLGLHAFFKAFDHQKKLCTGVALATAFSPFVWFYLNEARPYIMQLGGSFLVFASLYRLGSAFTDGRSHSQGVWSIGLAVGMFVVSASSMLGVIWVAAALAAALCFMGSKRAWNQIRSSPFLWMFTLAAFILLGIFYLWTLQRGARASGAAATDIKNLFFIGYEFFGFSGFGPGRLELRESGVKSLFHFLPLLAVHGFGVAVISVFAWRDRCALGTKLFWPVIFLVSAIAGLFLLGYVAHFRIVGRHFTPLLVAILFFLGFGLSGLWSRSGILSKIFAVSFVILNIVSCLLLRFAPRHENDDYRSAAAVAKRELAVGKTVMWNADKAGALYYQVPIADQASSGKAWIVLNPDSRLLGGASPQVVIASKPDLYDAQSALRKFLDENAYINQTNFRAFVVWEKL